MGLNQLGFSRQCAGPWAILPRRLELAEDEGLEPPRALWARRISNPLPYH